MRVWRSRYSYVKLVGIQICIVFFCIVVKNT